MSRKKIIFYLPLMTGGGAERVTMNIIKKLNRQYYEVHLVLGTKSLGNSLHLIPDNIYQHNLETDKTLYSILKLRKIVREINPYAIYSSLNRTHIALHLALIAMRNRPKTIMRIPSSPKLVDKYVRSGFLFNFFLNRALRSADTIVAQTPEMKEETQRYHHIKKEKIEVFINPLDIELIEHNLEDKTICFDKKNINVVASGRLSKEKGFDILIKAFQKVYVRDKNFRLYILGPDYDNQQQKYEDLIEHLGLIGIVNLLGFQKNPYRYYHQSDLFVLSSRWEGLPNAVLENLYLKKPIVATRCIPFMSQLIDNGENGFLVDVENINQLSESILKYQDLKSVGKESFKNSDVNEFFNGVV